MAEPLRLRVLDPGSQGPTTWKAELARLYRLDQVCFSPEIAYSRGELDAFIRHPSAWTVVVEGEAGELLGFAVVRTWRGFLHLLTIDVEPAARRRGIGRAMLAWAEERAKALGVPGLRLEVAVTNTGARAFYREQGFIEAGLLERYYPAGEDAVVMERRLEPGEQLGV